MRPSFAKLFNYEPTHNQPYCVPHLGIKSNLLFIDQPTTHPVRSFARFCYVGFVNSGYGYGSLPEVSGTGTEVFQNSQKFGYCGTGVQKSHKFRAGTKNAVPVPRVLLHGAYRAHRSSGYGYESLTELPEVPGIVARAYRTYRSFGQVCALQNTTLVT